MNVRPVQNMSGVYALLAHGGDGVYVGSSSRIDARIRAHFGSLRRGIHNTIALQERFDAGERFDVVVLEQCPRSICVEREQVWMDTLGPLLNTSNNAACSSLDERVAKKIGDAHRGKKMPFVSESNRRRTGTPWTPRDRDAWIAKLSATKTGQKWGPRDPSVGKKIAASLRGQPLSEERKAKISAAHKRFHAQLREQGLVQRRPRRTS